MLAATGSDKTITDLQNAIAAKIGSAGSVTVDGSKLKIASATTGSTSSVSVSVTGTTTTGIGTAFGFDFTENATGPDAVPASKTVTISNGTDTQVVSVTDETATSLTVSDGAFSGE